MVEFVAYWLAGCGVFLGVGLAISALGRLPHIGCLAAFGKHVMSAAGGFLAFVPLWVYLADLGLMYNQSGSGRLVVWEFLMMKYLLLIGCIGVAGSIFGALMMIFDPKGSICLTDAEEQRSDAHEFEKRIAKG